MDTPGPHTPTDTTDAPAFHPDAALLRLGAALDDAVASYWQIDALLSEGAPETVRDAPEAIEAAWPPCRALARRIAARPAQTLDGLAVKARALAVLGEEADGGTVVGGLVRVLGRAPS